MDVFVGNPPSFTRETLRQLFIRTIAKSNSKLFFWKSQSKHQVQVKQFTKQVSGKSRRYFVVHVETNNLALLIIKRLNLKVVDGRRLVVREYQSRGYMNERRVINWREQLWNKTERRKSERRMIQQGRGRYSELVSEMVDADDDDIQRYFLASAV
ncbi:hypothetical protein MNBD_GAMMA03-623 [hydrothermal vent metagenome]|uniref:RRM domain-containing protein n=1 Tax=hydrothermal vent metagenome TaxID=652676 RepID=A0A3B0WF45_9ZZZZ